jgi:hypothetical protein
MPPSRFIVLGSALALIALQESARADNRIESVAIVSESADEVVLDVVYTYDGDQGDNVAVSAVMAGNGEVSTHYAHRPARIERGRHRARVRLGTNAGAPEIFSTNRLEIAMYIGGGATFLRRQFDFAKTWSRPGATLSPVVHVAQLRPRLAVQRAPQLQQLETPPAQPDAGEAGAVSRQILPGGAVELHYPDGTIRKLFAGGQTITRPDGTSSTMLYQNAQPPTPPTAPPDASHANWLDAENERLLGIMRTLVGNDEPSIQNYLEREGDLTVYQRIEARTEAVGWLVSP